ncbi:nucleolin-like isoform 2-T2 [Odontesthes bonariensis]|uniref:nucleolin-like isoform X2 n=1 Tax=Odontesthes bonariensis TaxID=219752 RepID=UPI003F58F5BE
MAKKSTTWLSKRQNKDVEEENKVNHEAQTETVSSSELMSTEVEMKLEEDEEDLQMNTIIEVKRNTPTVTVSWEEENAEEEGDGTKRAASANDQMKGKEKQMQIISSAGTAVAPSQIPETKMEQEMGESEDEQESQKIPINEDNENIPTVAVTRKKKNKRGQGDGIEKESSGTEDTVVNGKRKAEPATETSSSKKTKLINDGFCLFVGNLNTSKTFEEIKDSLAKYFMTQSLLFHDIRLARSRKHAFVDLASEMDLAKALTLNGEKVLDKPVKIAKAKVKSEDKEKVKALPLDKKAKDARCLFLKNLPYDATKEDIFKIFRKAIAVRFPGGAEGPSQGIAFVEFRNETIAQKVHEKIQGAKIQDRVLIVDTVGEPNVPKANADGNKATAEAPPNNTLFLSNLSYNVKEKHLKNVFQKAISISIPHSKGKPRGYAFIEFRAVADAEKALQSSQNIKICKRVPKVQFCDARAKPEKEKVQSKTLIVVGLAEKTTAETLKSAFEGALSARVTVNKDTGPSKRFGFVEFESEEHCTSTKEAMEDCEIDGRKVTVAYAKPKDEKGGKRGVAGRPSKKSSGVGAHRGGRGGKVKGIAYLTAAEKGLV